MVAQSLIALTRGELIPKLLLLSVSNNPIAFSGTSLTNPSFANDNEARGPDSETDEGQRINCVPAFSAAMSLAFFDDKNQINIKKTKKNLSRKYSGCWFSISAEACRRCWQTVKQTFRNRFRLKIKSKKDQRIRDFHLWHELLQREREIERRENEEEVVGWRSSVRFVSYQRVGGAVLRAGRESKISSICLIWTWGV